MNKPVCVICGLRKLKGQWVPHELPEALKELGLQGKWAHASCIVSVHKLRMAERMLAASAKDHE